jgi:DNA-binding NtrC family response regulator
MTNVPSILVFDEEPMLRAATAMLLRNRGALVTTVGTVEEAIACLERRTFDVAVLDLSESSPRCMQILRSMKERGRVPKRVVICTSLPRTAADGLTEVLLKPYPFDRLLDVVFGNQARTRKHPARLDAPSDSAPRSTKRLVQRHAVH